MIAVRNATEDDRPIVEGVVRDAYQPFATQVGFRPAPLDADYGQLIDAGRVHVTHPRIDGVLVLSPEIDGLLVDNVAVHPEAQHRGVGGRLMSYAFDHAASEGFTSVRLYTHSLMTGNIAWYLSLGFTETGREPLPVGERVHLARQLGRRPVDTVLG